MKLEDFPKQVVEHVNIEMRGGECWERPLSCNGLVIAAAGDDGSKSI